MCGFAGIVGAAPLPDLDSKLAGLQGALVHRGPDGGGLWRNAECTVGLAHRRLAIIDLSEDARQPMSSADGRLTIAFNGEIYNFRELRRELESGGARFSTASDTEVLLHLYDRDGADCVRHLRGMFAFALWDARQGRCLLARDPLGIKPLYVAVAAGPAGEQVAFASEIRSLIAAGIVPGDTDPVALQAYLRAGSVPEPLTMVRGVAALPAGSILEWDRGRIRRRQYWTLPASRDGAPARDEADEVARLRAALVDSIRAHYVSDVPVGVFLSGGIDSTAVVALSRAAGKQDIRTFSIAFAEQGYDEARVARRTAAAFGTNHHEWLLDAGTAGGLLDEFFPGLDQPTVDGFNTWCVSRMARERGMKVVLSGLGGDELFAGYPSFRQIPVLTRLGQVPRVLRFPAGRLLERHAGTPQRRRLGEFLAGAGGLEEAWQACRSVLTHNEAGRLADWLTGGAVGPTPAPAATGEALPDEPLAARISRLELTHYMRNQLLRDCDVMSMAWGLELRVPFVDRQLAESAAGIPTRLRLAYGKRLLIRAVPELPEWVVNRPKTGFQFPFAHWIQGSWRERFDAVAREAPVPLQTWYQRWLVMAFQEWRRQATMLASRAATAAGRS
jgi:asparagine synthase (glutamine-hydrolysing)